VSARVAKPLALLGAVLLATACGDGGLQRVSAQLLVAGDTLDFGAVPVLNEKVLAVELTNTGRGRLVVRKLELLSTDTPFRIITPVTEIAGGDKATLELGFRPPAEAPYETKLTLDSNDEESQTRTFTLTGVGSTRAVMALSPALLDFGRVAEGTSVLKSFVVASQGSADLLLEQIAFADPTTSTFSFVGSVKTPARVKAPSELLLAIKYTVPLGAPAESTGAVTVSGTDPDLPQAQVALKGTVNRAPIPVIAPLPTGSPGMVVTLDGSASNDPDGDVPLTYQWTLRQKPLGSSTQIGQPGSALTSMTLDPDLPGEYEVELTVTDAAGAKAGVPARARIVAEPAQKLLVEMFWDNAHTDVDLHFLRTQETAIGAVPDDCHYANATPDWGISGDATDDPSFLRDALTGYGPEVVGYDNPASGKYRVLIELRNTLGSATPSSGITVRIYLRGVLTKELKRTLGKTGETWNVADIAWPSGIVEEVP
jgi:hypothetical protein